MDLPLILFAGSAVFFTYRGYRRGLLTSLSRVLGLLGGYLAAILYTQAAATWLQAHTTLQGVIAYAAAAVTLFIGVGLAVSLVFGLLARLIPPKDALVKLSATGGALMGLAVGVVVGLALVWSLGLVRDMQATPVSRPQASAVESLARSIAGKAVSTAMQATEMQPEVASISAALIRSPVEIAGQLKRLTQSQELANLLNRPDNQEILNRGDRQALMQAPDFQKLADNPDMQALVRASGLVADGDDGAEAIMPLLADQVTSIWQRTQRMKHDSRVQAILQDPEFQRQVQSGNPLALLTNPQFVALAEVLFSEQEPIDAVAAGIESHVQSVSEPEAVTPRPTAKIYRWVDENGRTHFSDVDPKQSQQ